MWPTHLQETLFGKLTLTIISQITESTNLFTVGRPNIENIDIAVKSSFIFCLQDI